MELMHGCARNNGFVLKKFSTRLTLFICLIQFFLVDQRTSVTLVQKTTSLEEFLDPKFHVPPSFIPQNTLQVFDAYRADISCFMLCI